MKYLKYIAPLVSILFFYGCKISQPKAAIKIAFMADVHFADVYPDVEDMPRDAFIVSKKGENILIRTMEAQLHSTRLFNENYFAFTAALDDAVRRGIKIIALPGDFSDDGQPLHITGLKKIMDSYVENHGVSFFVINGNHDPTRPFGKEGGERDFLGANGKAQPIMSEEGMYTSNSDKENETQIFNAIQEWGYKDIVQELHDFGFFPQEDYIYWETPFSTYTYEEYDFAKAIDASQLENRTYKFDATETVLPDVSYLVEPIKGVWLLALDANVYIPKDDGSGFNGAGIGYNEVLNHKKHLLEWTGNVAKEASRLGKTLIAFSHYPMIDFNDDASADMKELFGETSFQAHRIPNELVGKTFADLGLKVHVGGHMHLNDTGTVTTEKGNTLTNIQTPSLAAYAPGYKIITLTDKGELEVETVALDSISGFDTFFELYKKEHVFLESNFPDEVWGEKILSSKTYLEFTNTHLKELVRLRFMPNDWPKELKEQLVNHNGWQLVTLALTSNEQGEELSTSIIDESKLLDILKENELTKADFEQWNGLDLIYDFYRFRSGDQLALKDVDSTRLKTYKFLFKRLLENTNNNSLVELRLFATIFQKQMNGEPAVNFTIVY